VRVVLLVIVLALEPVLAPVLEPVREPVTCEPVREPGSVDAACAVLIAGCQCGSLGVPCYVGHAASV
jgi:hypothetical protein